MEREKAPHTGLTRAEVEARIADGKTNRQPQTAGKTVWQILAGNLFTLFNGLNALLAAALIAVGSWRNLLFLGVVISNTVIGTVQELRAKRTIDRLKLLSDPKVTVLRDGAAQAVACEDVVLDDLFRVGPGDQLCVDGVVIEGGGAVNESLLTGESDPVDKAPDSEVFSGSYVVEGHFLVRATRVGADSYAARLTASARQIRAPKSELMRSMRLIIRTVGAAIVPLGLIQFAKQFFWMDRGIEETVVSTASAMLGMIPEGLMLLTSVALAVGVVRLGRRNTLVSDLYGIESLARVDTLCVDKTGTITRGDLSIGGVQPLGGADPACVERKLGILSCAIGEDNATGAALSERFAPIARAVACRVPFSSARKWSGASFEGIGSLVLGAPEFVLGDAMSPSLTARIRDHAARGERVLLLCESADMLTDKALPENLTPLALVMFTDVLRDDARETLAFFREQDVDVKVISGDNPLTVQHVAHRAGLVGEAVDARTLDTPDRIAEAARRYTIFGRVTPEQKQAIIEALKAQGHTVGMMGDGVNDIPALKAADCAIAMAGGSDAARRVSQLTLLDSRFSAVPQIVMEGRRVINNIQRAASLFLVKTTFAFLLSLLLVFLPRHYPFAPIQMTLISSLTVGIPSFFLALEPSVSRVKGNFLHTVVRNALPGGLTIVLQILIMMALAGVLRITEAQQSTIAVWTTGVTALLVLLHTARPLNELRGALVAVMAAGFITGAVAFGEIFYLVPLSPVLWALTGGLMVLSPAIMQLLRWAVDRVAPAREGPENR